MSAVVIATSAAIRAPVDLSSVVSEVFSNFDLCSMIMDFVVGNEEPIRTKAELKYLVNYYAQLATLTTGFRGAADARLNLMTNEIINRQLVRVRYRQLIVDETPSLLASSGFVRGLVTTIAFAKSEVGVEDLKLISQLRNCDVVTFFRTSFSSAIPVIEVPESVKYVSFTRCSHDFVAGPNLQKITFLDVTPEMVNRARITTRGSYKIPSIRIHLTNWRENHMVVAAMFSVATHMRIGV